MMNDFWSLLTQHAGFEFLALASAKATILLAFVALLCLAFRRFSAATRHLLWSLMLCASLLIPFISYVKSWELPILPAQAPAQTAFEASKSTLNEPLIIPDTRLPQKISNSFEASDGIKKKSEFKTNAEFSEEIQLVPNTSELEAQPQKNVTSLFQQSVNWILIVWFAGMLLLLFRLLVGLTATNFLASRAADFKDAALNELFSSLLIELNLKSKVRLLRSERTLMPVVCGVFRPAVLLPANADNWSKERQRMVLLHELTHVARRDCLTQLLAQTACAFYWFNPLVWYAARRLRVERERACDDFVLSVGAKPSDYAHHLLEIARSIKESSVFEWSQTATVAMARQSQLEGRLLAILRNEGKRQTMSPLTTVILVTLICVLLLPLAVIRPTAINAQNPQLSENTSNSKTAVAENTSLDSFPSTGFNDEAAISEANSQETVKRQENSIVGNDNQQAEPGLANSQIEGGTKRALAKGDIESDVEQDVSEDTAQQSVASKQTPEVNSQNGLVSNPFINANFEEKRKPEAQEKSGDFIDEMASVGYTNLTVDELIKLKTSGVTADYVKNLRALGFANLTVKELASMSIHQVAPAYIQAIRSSGYNNLSARDLTTFRIHDIKPEFIRTLRDAGYGNLAAGQLIQFAVHGVTPAFIGGIRAAGYGNLSPRELVSLRIYNVNPEFIRKARSRLGELTVKQIISLKNVGAIDDDKDKDKEKDKDQG